LSERERVSNAGQSSSLKNLICDLCFASLFINSVEDCRPNPEKICVSTPVLLAHQGGS
jgi:hypothetical protein